VNNALSISGWGARRIKGYCKLLIGVASLLLLACAAAPSMASAAHYGIDVSAYQAPINWPAVAASGQRFAIIKATDGTSGGNSYFASDYRAAKANGLIATGYHWGRPDYGQAELQADRVIDAMNWSNDGKTMPPMLDIEYGTMVGSGNCYNLSPSALVGWVQRFVNRVTARIGRGPMIYTNAYWWNDCTASNTSFGHLPLVIANYGAAPSPLPAGWNTYAIWQFTETGRISGINGNVDRDVTRDDNTLAQLTGGSGPPPTPSTYQVDTNAAAPGYDRPGGTKTGTLNKGTNYVYCRRIGPKVTSGSSYNSWWLKTDLDTGQQGQWVSAIYLSKWGNDEAKDNSGKLIPLCDQPYGTIGTKWNAIGGGSSVIGWPTLPEMAAKKNGRFQQFERGIILWKSDVAHVIRGAILDRFWANGGEEKLGFAKMDEAAAAKSPGGTIGRYQYFDDGVILWSAATGAYWVHGAIEQKFASSGREAKLGYPKGEEVAEGTSGRKQVFQNATIHWTAAKGAWVTTP
jgi:GH25 family lysozyme M1 (1,4-beta-N-acetylmuramidase)